MMIDNAIVLTVLFVFAAYRFLPAFYELIQLPADSLMQILDSDSRPAGKHGLDSGLDSGLDPGLDSGLDYDLFLI